MLCTDILGFLWFPNFLLDKTQNTDAKDPKIFLIGDRHQGQTDLLDKWKKKCDRVEAKRNMEIIVSHILCHYAFNFYFLFPSKLEGIAQMPLGGQGLCEIW